LFWFVLVCFGLFLFVSVCFGLFRFVSVCFILFYDVNGTDLATGDGVALGGGRAHELVVLLRLLQVFRGVIHLGVPNETVLDLDDFDEREWLMVQTCSNRFVSFY
jgi:hypothetical protein